MSAQNHAINARIFLVGCERSGTTLLQVLVTGHPRVHSFPETSFFVNGIGRRRRPLAWLGLATGRERWSIGLFLKRISREDLADIFPRRPLLLRTAVDGFVRILDHLAFEAGKDVWLEKSPMHIHYIGFIKRYVPSPHFIHIVRDGRDVVASIYDRALKFPQKFGHQRDLASAVRKWNRALRVSPRYIGRPGHTFVLYEQLVQEPDKVLSRIYHDLGLEYDPCKKDVDEVAHQVIMPNQQWVMGAVEPPQPMPSKFDQLFDQKTRDWITRRLKLGELEEVKAKINSVQCLMSWES
jgi:hypothetical protein